MKCPEPNCGGSAHRERTAENHAQLAQQYEYWTCRKCGCYFATVNRLLRVITKGMKNLCKNQPPSLDTAHG